MDEHQEPGHPPDEPFETISRHVTSEGILVYTRYACGSLSLRLHRWGEDSHVVAESTRPAPQEAHDVPVRCT